MQPVLGTCRRVSRRKSLLCSRPFSLVSGRRFQTGKDLKSVQRPPASEQSRPSTAWPPELRRAAGPTRLDASWRGFPGGPVPDAPPRHTVCYPLFLAETALFQSGTEIRERGRLLWGGRKPRFRGGLSAGSGAPGASAALAGRSEHAARAGAGVRARSRLPAQPSPNGFPFPSTGDLDAGWQLVLIRQPEFPKGTASLPNCWQLWGRSAARDSLLTLRVPGSTRCLTKPTSSSVRECQDRWLVFTLEKSAERFGLLDFQRHFEMESVSHMPAL